MKLGYKCGILLSDRTSLKIGGPASFWLEPEDPDGVLEVISFAEKENKALAIIGSGSNILAQDRGFDGVVINLGQGFDYIEREQDTIVRVGSARPISQLVKDVLKLGLGGCEFLSGIPGSFGGALFMNAGVSHGKVREEIKDIIIDVDVIDLRDRKKMNLKRQDIDFSYRSSGLDGRCILGARIRLERRKRSAILDRIDSYMERREWIQRLAFPSAGSVFKNPDSSNTAGRLIEGCGLKGSRIGGAEISKIHANVIVNTGSACSKDVKDLIELAKRRVKERFGIELELELRVLL
jgi:UDP-N-acetylmuramate dehydrogenase